MVIVLLGLELAGQNVCQQVLTTKEDQTPDYRVAYLRSQSFTYDIILYWDNPELEFTGLVLNYSTYYMADQSIALDSNTTMFSIQNLEPGTDVFVIISTYLDGELMANTNIYTTSTCNLTLTAIYKLVITV